MHEQNWDPYCGIIPSPAQLDRNINSPDLDVIQTRRDFNHVWEWLSKFSNIECFKDVKTTLDRGEQLELSVFDSAIHSSFQAFDPIRDTSSPKAKEMVLLYYAGHGLSVEGATQLNKANPDGWSSSPRLEKVGYSHHKEYFSAAQPHLTRNRNVKGGELCLHDVGFCDLQGLLKPFIAAVKGESTKSFGEKHNKHVVIIADSCYSGKLVEDLATLNQWPGPWNENDCTVTVQSACNSHEVTFGGYFTPCFVYYNQTGGACPTDTKEYPADTTECPADTRECRADAECPADTTECAADTRECPADTTQCPADTTECPADKRECPADTTQCPADTRECPADTKCPTNAGECPADTTECSADTRECPADTTESSADTRECPADTKCPGNARKCPADTTECSADTRECPADATESSADTRECPADTTECPADARE